MRFTAPDEVPFGTDFNISAVYAENRNTFAFPTYSRMDVDVTFSGTAQSIEQPSDAGGTTSGTFSSRIPLMAMGAVGQSMSFTLNRFVVWWELDTQHGTQVISYVCHSATPTVLGSVTVAPPPGGALVDPLLVKVFDPTTFATIYQAEGLIDRGSFLVVGNKIPGLVPYMSGTATLPGPDGDDATLGIQTGTTPDPQHPGFRSPITLLSLSDPAAGIDLVGHSATTPGDALSAPYVFSVSGEVIANLPGHGNVIVYWQLEPFTECTWTTISCPLLFYPG